jgi:hypothetical protein
MWTIFYLLFSPIVSLVDIINSDELNDIPLNWANTSMGRVGITKLTMKIDLLSDYLHELIDTNRVYFTPLVMNARKEFLANQLYILFI